MAIFAFCFVVLVAPTYANGQTAGGVAAGITAGAIAGSVIPGVGTAVGAAVGGVAAVVAPAATKFAGNAVGAFAGVVIGWIVFVINYVVAFIFGIAVGILAWFISIVLQLNTNITHSNIVLSGFNVTLALANLGFVLAIIVIAIMTILRYETYSLKKTLWKLVAAAILVNFSLVICAAILNFADTLTLYFMTAFNPAGGGGSSFDSFATSLAGAFRPQSIFLNLNAQGGQTFDAANFDKFAGAGTSFVPTLVALMNLFFPTLFLIVSVIAMAGLFIMLLIRYVYLGILIILMPLAWLLWIFPVTSGQWHKWWSKFIQWTIFAPVVMFFLYLALMTLGGASANQVSNPTSFFSGLGITADMNSPIGGFVSTSLGGASPSFGTMFLGSFLQMVMMVAMVFAGLFMAQSMGIMFADTTMKGMKAVTSGFGRLVGRKGLQTAGMAMNKLKVREGAQKLQQTQFGKGRGRIGRALGAVANYGTGWLGRGMENVTVGTREDLVKDAKKRLAEKTDDQLANNRSTYNAHERVAADQLLFERGALEKVRNEEDLEPDFKAFNQGGSLAKMQKQGQFANNKILEALPEAMKGNLTELNLALKEFIKTLSKSDISSNKQLNDIFSGGKFMGRDADHMKVLNQAMIKEMAINNPQLIAAIIPKLKGEALENFQKLFETAKQTMTTDEAKTASERFDTMINNNIFYAGEGPTQQGGATTQQSAQPSSTKP